MTGTNEAVNDAVWWTVSNAVFNAVSGVMWGDVSRVYEAVYDAVVWDVDRDVEGAVDDGSGHPALQDFLLNIKESL